MGLSDRPLRRLTQLFAGLVAFGLSVALMVRARLGLGPWDVLHQGLARRTGLGLGTIVIAVSVTVLLLWIPLRQRPGVGTICNVILVGLAVDWGLALFPTVDHMAARVLLLVAGVVGNGAATALYIGAGLGPGPRDGLMTGLALRGISIRAGRTAIELSVLALGWALGGVAGIGTVLFALSIGPLAQLFLPLLSITPAPAERDFARGTCEEPA